MKILFYCIFWLLLFLFSFGTFLFLFVRVSNFIKSIRLLTLISLLGQSVVLILLGSLNTSLFYGEGSTITYFISAGIILMSILLLKFTLFKALPGAIMEKVLPKDTQYMTLETGSKVAYWSYEAIGKSECPILYIHGGPGAHVREIDREFFKSFAKEGYDVYLYDQPGGGFSETIPLHEYTMERSIKDIDLIIKKIGVDKVILVGQSFGGNICSAYACEYPDKVKSIIFTAPGGLRPKSLMGLNKEKKALEKSNITFATEKIKKFEPNIREVVRFATAVMMCKHGGRQTVENLVSQKEMTEYATRAIPEAIHMAYHVRYADRVPVIKSGGINVLVNASLNVEYKKISYKVIEKVKNLKIPALIIRAEFDYVEWAATKHYNTIFENSYLVYISESGHIPWSVNIDDTYDAMLYFLKEQYDQLDIYTGSKDPRLNK